MSNYQSDNTLFYNSTIVCCLPETGYVLLLLARFVLFVGVSEHSLENA